MWSCVRCKKFHPYFFWHCFKPSIKHHMCNETFRKLIPGKLSSEMTIYRTLAVAITFNRSHLGKKSMGCFVNKFSGLVEYENGQRVAQFSNGWLMLLSCTTEYRKIEKFIPKFTLLCRNLYVRVRERR